MELIYRLRTEGDSPSQQSWAIAIGVAIGCTPLYGLHLPMCIVAAKLLSLSRFKMFLATNLNNPLFAPFLVFGEIELGSLLRRGSLYGLEIEELKSVSLSTYAADLAIGSLTLGAILGIAAGLLTYFVLKQATIGRYRRLLVEESGRRFLDVGLTSWEIVRNTLHFDPVYLAIVTKGLLSEGLLVQIGAGRGALLALLATYQEQQFQEDRLPDCAAAPARLTCLGLESRRGNAAVARKAGLPVQRVDLRSAAIPSCQCVVMIDVLRRFKRKVQDDLLQRAAAALSPGGILLLRETDAARSWRYLLKAFTKRLLLILRGRPRQQLNYRSLAHWTISLESLGFEVTPIPISQSNVLLRAVLTRNDDLKPLDNASS
jgi:uncharacterized protein (DUF2062 family)